jgi:hypothetical protein
MLIALFFSLSAFANPPALESISKLFEGMPANSNLCFGREYSESHLESRPQQKVKLMRAKLVRDDSTPDFPSRVLETEIVLTGEENQNRIFRTYFLCLENSEKCTVECDGGSILALGNPQTLRVENLGFLLAGNCGNGKEKKLVPSKNGDDVFSLEALPAAFCQ